ncbi:putative transcriptional regulator [Acinetobacter baumannii]|nr:putative transcriptional regulator [Acinetobacter baumannii]
MSIEYLEIDPGELWPNPWNSNVVSPENERKIEEGY